jgi:hypothetical protein
LDQFNFTFLCKSRRSRHVIAARKQIDEKMVMSRLDNGRSAIKRALVSDH